MIMTIKQAYIKNISSFGFRQGILAEIIGVKMVKPSDKLDERPCYYVRYKDGYEDFIAISDNIAYEIVTLEKELGIEN